MRNGRKAIAIAAAALSLVALGGVARAEIVQKGEVRVSVLGGLKPSKLPRDGLAPISVKVGGRISTVDQTPPPQLQALSIEINRHGRLDGHGLPVCRIHDVQPASTSRALAACRPALVGRGTFEADATLSGQQPYPTKGELLLFNGVQRGKPVLLGQIYAARPFANSFVIVFQLRHLARGAYGTELKATLPRALTNWGNLTALTMTLSRRYTYRGERRSYVSAGCPAPKALNQVTFQLARTNFSFADGKQITTSLTRNCQVRGR